MAKELTFREILGMIFQRLELAPAIPWVQALSMYITTTQPEEIYKWLGHVPIMREWIGGRQAFNLTTDGVKIINKPYEATIDFFKKDIAYDKTGQVLIRISEFVEQASTHWEQLLSALIVAAASTACYDGQYFFDTDHPYGSSGTQSNDINVDISAAPVGDSGSHGTVTAPSNGEMAYAMMKGITQILSMVNDQGQPMNQSARSFIAMVPNSLYFSAEAAVSNTVLAQGMSNLLPNSKYKIEVVSNQRLDLAGWTDEFCMFRADGYTKPFIRQAETDRPGENEDITVEFLAEGSELEFEERKHRFGISADRNVGTAFYQDSCFVTMI